MTLWLKLEKRMKLAITLHPDDVEDVQDIGNSIADNYTRVEMPFNSFMAEFFEGTNIKELIQPMLPHVKRQEENIGSNHTLKHQLS